MFSISCTDDGFAWMQVSVPEARISTVELGSGIQMPEEKSDLFVIKYPGSSLRESSEERGCKGEECTLLCSLCRDVRRTRIRVNARFEVVFFYYYYFLITKKRERESAHAYIIYI